MRYLLVTPASELHKDLQAIAFTKLRIKLPRGVFMALFSDNKKFKGMVILHNITPYTASMSVCGVRGFITKTLIKRVAIECFENLKLCRIEARIYPKNTTALNLAMRLGFKKEGVLRQISSGNDMVVLSMLPGECPFYKGAL